MILISLKFIHVTVLGVDWTEERRKLKAEKKWKTLSQAQHDQYARHAAKKFRDTRFAQSFKFNGFTLISIKLPHRTPSACAQSAAKAKEKKSPGRGKLQDYLDCHSQ